MKLTKTIMKRKIYTAHNPQEVLGFTCEGVSKTKQSFREETDINQLVKRYHQTGLLPRRSGQPAYGDFSGAEDYSTAQLRIKDAEASFEALPIKIKQRFKNNPGNLMDFLANKKNNDEAIDLGLIDGEKTKPI